LTKEQYAGVAKVPKVGLLNTSRDALNPLLNTETLKNRLFVIQHYKYLHGVEFAHWPHFVLRNIGNNLMKYKYNYAVKGFAAFMLYRAVSEYKGYNSRAFLTMDQHGYFAANIIVHSAIFAGVSAII
jgi:hypothetical protein